MVIIANKIDKVGLFQEKSKERGAVLRIYFSENPPGIF